MKKINALKKLHEQSEEIDEEYKKERIALEEKYRNRKASLIDQRTGIVSGDIEVPDEPSEDAGEYMYRPIPLIIVVFT
jgi:Nucleosome assembly protein (NAP)